DGLPGPVRVAQPVAHGALPPPARLAPARGPHRTPGQPGRARPAAWAGPPIAARAVPRRLPARAFGRSAPTRGDRAGTGRRAPGALDRPHTSHDSWPATRDVNFYIRDTSLLSERGVLPR